MRMLLGFPLLALVAITACTSSPAGEPALDPAPSSATEPSATERPTAEVTEREIQIADESLGPLTFHAIAAGDPAAAEDGRLVLLLHGFPETGESYREFLPALADAGYYAVAPDQRGYSPGARPGDVAEYAVPRLVADTTAIATALGADTFHLVGHDWGGGVAWTAGALFPDRITSLTVLSTPHPDALTDAFADPSGEQAALSSYMITFRQDGTEDQILADGSASFEALFTAGGLPADAAATYAEVLGTPDALGAALDWYRANPLPLAFSLGPVSVPTLFVFGADDGAFSQGAADGTAGYVTGPYTYEVLAGQGHWLPELADAEVTGLLLDHLTSVE